MSWYLIPKALQYFFNATLASINPFLSLYYRDRSLEGSQIGLMLAIPPLMNFFGSMFWASQADRTGKTKKLLVVCAVTALFFVSMLYFDFPYTSLFILAPIVMCYSFFLLPITALIDSLVLHMLDGQRELYGKQRLWGSIGWGFTSLVVGIIMDHTTTRAFFFSFALWSCIFVIICVLFVKEIPPKEKPDEARKSPLFFFKSAKKIINLQMSLFMGTTLIMGAAAAVISNFILLFMIEYLNASETLYGFRMISMIVVEVPVFYFSKQLVQRIGFVKMIIASHCVYILRCILYLIITDAWMILPVEMLHGIFFGCFWTAGVVHMNEMAPEGLTATSQGIFFGTFSGLGVSIGSLLGGYVYGKWGPYVLFTLAASAVVCSLILFSITEYVYNRKAKQVMVRLVEIPEEKDVEEGHFHSEIDSASVRTATSVEIDSTITPSETSEDESGHSELETAYHDEDVITYSRRKPISSSARL